MIDKSLSTLVLVVFITSVILLSTYLFDSSLDDDKKKNILVSAFSLFCIFVGLSIVVMIRTGMKDNVLLKTFTGVAGGFMAVGAILFVVGFALSRDENTELVEHGGKTLKASFSFFAAYVLTVLFLTLMNFKDTQNFGREQLPAFFGKIKTRR